MLQHGLLKSFSDIVARIRKEISGPPTVAPDTRARPAELRPDIPGYKIVGRLGEGGMGAVYLAEDETLGRKVAIKVISDLGADDRAARRLFLREAKAMASVAHPNVVHIYSFGESDSGPYIVMERIEGESLSKRLRESRVLSAEQALEIICQAIDGLEAAWEKGIIHRDVKPSNILIDPKGQVRVCDFGLARPVPTEVTAERTDSDRIAGTPHYMSPEQALGRPTDLRSDMYSLGIVLYEMLAGRPPISIKEPLEVLADHVEGSLDGLRDAADVTDEIAGLYEWMTETDPADRPTSYAALRSRVEAIRDGVQPVPWWATPWARVGAAVLAISATFLALTLLSGGDGPQFRPTVMVTVFDNETGEVDLNYLGAALADAIERSLKGTQTAFTLVSHEPFGSGSNVSEARANLVVTGSVSGSLAYLRIDVRLMSLDANEILAVRTIEGSGDESIVLGVRLVEAVNEMLHGELDAVAGQVRVRSARNEQANISYQRGRVYLREADTTDELGHAIDFFEDAIAADETFAPAHAALGLALRAMFRFTEENFLLTRALSSCSTARDLDPDFDEAFLCFGWVHSDLGEYEKALDDFGRAIDLGATAAGHRGLGMLYTTLDDRSLAERHLLDALRRDPAYPGAYLSLGRFYALQGDYETAIDYYLQALDQAPDSARAHMSLGAMYLYAGRYQEAIDTTLTSIRQAPTVDAYSNLGMAYFAVGRLDEAIAAYQEAIAAGNARYVTYGNLARVYHIYGDDEAARPYFVLAAQGARDALNTNPNDLDPKMLLAYYEAMLGNVAAARTRIQEVIEAEGEFNMHEAYYWVAMAFVELGDHPRAIEFLGKAVDANYSINDIRGSPEFDVLQSNEEYRRLVGDTQ